MRKENLAKRVAQRAGSKLVTFHPESRLGRVWSDLSFFTNCAPVRNVVLVNCFRYKRAGGLLQSALSWQAVPARASTFDLQLRLEMPLSRPTMGKHGAGPVAPADQLEEQVQHGRRIEQIEVPLAPGLHSKTRKTPDKTVYCLYTVYQFNRWDGGDHRRFRAGGTAG